VRFMRNSAKNILMKAVRIDVLIALLLFTLSLSFYLHYATPTLWSPDEMRAVAGAESLIQHGDLNLNNPLNQDYETTIFNPGFTVYKNEYEQYPMEFTGSVLFYTFVIGLFGKPAFFLMAPLFGAIGVVAMYFIVRKIFSHRYLGVLAAVALFSTSLWIRWSTEHVNMVPMVTFFLLSFMCLVSFKNNLRLILAGIFLSIAIMIRLPAALLVIPFLIFLYMEHIQKRQYLFFLAPIFITILVVFPVSNYALYGDPLYIPMNHAYYYPGFGSSTTSEATSFLSQFGFGAAERDAIVETFGFFFTRNFASLFLPLSVLGAVLLFRKRSKRKIAVFMTLVFLVFIVFHGRAYAGYGYGVETLQSTVLRYLVPVYVLLPIGLAGLLDDSVGKIIKSANVKILFCSLLAVVMLASLSFTIKYPYYGLDMFEGYRQSQIEVGSHINTLIPMDAIIVTDQVCAVPSAEKHDNVIYYPQVPESMRYQEIQRVLTLALEDSREVYFAGAFYTGSEANTEIVSELSGSFTMTELTEVRYIHIYKVSSQ
jgi:4-amino-4-deoxy-L-arabinose transferase-like glycosyltransferase